MIVIDRRVLQQFVDSLDEMGGQLAASSALSAWVEEVGRASWTNIGEVKSLYPTARTLSAGHIVFNILGTDYCLDVKVDFEKGIVWTRWIGTPDEHNRTYGTGN